VAIIILATLAAYIACATLKTLARSKGKLPSSSNATFTKTYFKA
jgi:hypothetical protein